MAAAALVGLGPVVLGQEAVRGAGPGSSGCLSDGDAADCVSQSDGQSSTGEAPAPTVLRVEPPCTWEMQLVDPTGGRHPGGIHRDPATPGLTPPGPGPTTETWYVWNCDGPAGRRFAWFPTASPPALSAADLVPGVVDRARRSAPAPVLDISPPESAHGVVYIGMFLAIEPVAPFTVRSEAGPVWGQADVTLDSTVWDMGNGDVVECPGPGVPWDGSDLPAAVEGPCGYTYRWPSVPEFTGSAELAYAASVTAVWSVRVTASDGRDELIAPIERRLDYSYPVFEIRTVGVPTG